MDIPVYPAPCLDRLCALLAERPRVLTGDEGVLITYPYTVLGTRKHPTSKARKRHDAIGHTEVHVPTPFSLVSASPRCPTKIVLHLVGPVSIFVWGVHVVVAQAVLHSSYSRNLEDPHRI
jgi:hypothetical protein